MAGEKCPCCGKSFTAIFGKATRIHPYSIAKLQELHIDTDVCFDCIQQKISQMRADLLTQYNNLFQTYNEQSENIFKKVAIFSSPAENYPPITIVSAYQLASVAVHAGDVVTGEMEKYKEQLQGAELLARHDLCWNALKAGGDAVANVRMQVTNSSLGAGLLLITLTGDVINTGTHPDFKDFIAAAEALEHTAQLKATLDELIIFPEHATIPE